jgi:subtilisin
LIYCHGLYHGLGGMNVVGGVIGVAPGTTMVAVKILDKYGSGSWAQVVCGLDWLINHRISHRIGVASMSLAGRGSSDQNCGHDNKDPLHTSICAVVDSGIVVVTIFIMHIAISTPSHAYVIYIVL